MFGVLLISLGLFSAFKMDLDVFKGSFLEKNPAPTTQFIEVLSKLNPKVAGTLLDSTLSCPSLKTSSCPFKMETDALWSSNITRDFSNNYFTFLEQFKNHGLWFGLEISPTDQAISKRNASTILAFEAYGKSVRIWINGTERKFESTRTLPPLRNYTFFRLTDEDFSTNKALKITILLEKASIVNRTIPAETMYFSDGLASIFLTSEYSLSQRQNIINSIGLPIYCGVILLILGLVLTAFLKDDPSERRMRYAIVKLNSGTTMRISADLDERLFKIAVSSYKTYFHPHANLELNIVQKDSSMVLTIKDSTPTVSTLDTVRTIDEHKFAKFVNRVLGVQTVYFAYSDISLDSKSKFASLGKELMVILGLVLAVPLLGSLLVFLYLCS
jgi:hypothetical protein